MKLTDGNRGEIRCKGPWMITQYAIVKPYEDYQLTLILVTSATRKQRRLRLMKTNISKPGTLLNLLKGNTFTLVVLPQTVSGTGLPRSRFNN